MSERPHFRTIALIVGAAMFMEQLDGTVLATALPGMARANAKAELDLLAAIAAPVMTGDVPALAAELKAMNLALWDIEDQIRDHERARDFGEGFVALARAVYRSNDARGALKRRISTALGSALIEEKSYQPY
jgi:hypothetical protein